MKINQKLSVSYRVGTIKSDYRWYQQSIWEASAFFTQTNTLRLEAVSEEQLFSTT